MSKDWAKQESYEDVKYMLFRLCHRYHGCGRCSIEDRMSRANLEFTRAYAAYDSSRANFTTFLWYYVRNGLIDECSRCERTNKQQTSNSELVESLPSKHNMFWDQVAYLSNDAKEVVDLVVGVPEELIDIWIGSNDARGMLRTYLHAVGWTMSRITEAFSEVGELIQP